MEPTLVVLAAGVGRRFGGLKQLEPVGPSGEALLEYSLHDALRAGFGRVVLVVRPETEEEFRRLLEPRLGDGVALSYVHQALSALPAGEAPPAGRTKPWGTGHAVLVAEAAVNGPFAVVNADDFYGADAFRVLGEELREGTDGALPTFALAGFRVGSTLSDAGPVSRGLCRVDSDGWLERIVEVSELSRHPAGARYVDREGRQQLVSADAPVSMNMWGLTPALFAALRTAFARFLERLDPLDADASELLLPEVVQAMIDAGDARVRVLRHDGQWCGITFPGDRERVAAFLAERVARGEYPSRLWG